MKEFHQAASKGDIATLQALLEKQKSEKGGIDEIDPETGKTALHFAVEGGHAASVQWLLENKANIDAIDRNYDSPLSLAASKLDDAMVNVLLEKSAKTLVFKNAQEALTPLVPLIKLRDVYIQKFKEMKSQGQEILPDELKKLLLCEGLLRTLKTKVLSEAQDRWQKQSSKGAKGVSLQPNGILCLGSAEEIIQLNEKNKKTNMQMVTMDKKGNVEHQEILSNGKPVVNSSARSLYPLPPLVFFASHLDKEILNFIVHNFNFLKQLGYKTLCYEYDHDLTLEATISKFDNTIATIENHKCLDSSQPQREQEKFQEQLEVQAMLKIQVEFLRKAAAETWLKYVGVDKALGELRKLSLMPILPVLNPIREREFAQRIAAEARESQGGIIAIFGTFHMDFQKNLLVEEGPIAECYQFYHGYSTDDISKLYNISHYGLTLQQYHNALTKMKVIDLNLEKGQDQALAIFKKQLSSVKPLESKEIGEKSAILLQYKTKDLEQALRRSATCEDVVQLEKLLKFTIDINSQDINPVKGFTALHLTILHKKPDNAVFLLGQGALYNIPDKTSEKMTAVDYAIQENMNNVLEFIEKEIIFKAYKVTDPELALRMAADKGDIDNLKVLIALKVDVNKPGAKSGQTALDRAIEKGHKACIRLLIKHSKIGFQPT